MKPSIVTFADALRRNLDGYDGEHAEVVRYCPDLYDFFLNLLDDARFPPRHRHYANAVITYLVCPADVIPESEHGAGGYIDDVFLCAYVIKKLALELGDTGLLDASWYGAEGLLDVADHILEETSKSIPRETRWQILRYVGVEEHRENVT